MTSKKIEAVYTSDVWDEKDITNNLEGATLRITRTRTDRTFTGGMKGSGITEYTFAYYPLPGAQSETATESTEAKDPKDEPKEVTYNGIMYYKGTIDGVEGEGEIVFETAGTWNKGGNKRAVGSWTTIPASGKGAFKDLRASGGYDGASHTMPCWLQLD